MMLEKNSQIVLTPLEVEEYNQGVISDRVKQAWGIETIDELRELLKTQKSTFNYKDIRNGSN
jgi:hypothetical protein